MASDAPSYFDGKTFVNLHFSQRENSEFCGWLHFVCCVNGKVHLSPNVKDALHIKSTKRASRIALALRKQFNMSSVWVSRLCLP